MSYMLYETFRMPWYDDFLKQEPQMYSRFMNDPLDEEYLVSLALWVPMLMVKSRQKRLR